MRVGESRALFKTPTLMETNASAVLVLQTDGVATTSIYAVLQLLLLLLLLLLQLHTLSSIYVFVPLLNQCCTEGSSRYVCVSHRRISRMHTREKSRRSIQVYKYTSERAVCSLLPILPILPVGR